MMLPLVVWMLIPSEKVDSQVVEVPKVRVIDVTDTFQRRWPVPTMGSEIPLVNVVRTITIRKENESVIEVPPPEVNEKLERKRGIHKARYAYRDICARHNMRRVVTNGGKSWRCRRMSNG